MTQYDVAVVGGGILGLASSLALLTSRPMLRLVVLEKEPELAYHQTGHNSGVIHSGLYYRPGSVKARLCRAGAHRLRAFADEHGIPYKTCGKLVVATDDLEIPALVELHRRGTENGVVGMRWIGRSEISTFEAAVVGARALHVPETGIIDFRRVATALGQEITSRGGEVRLGTHINRVRVARGGVELLSRDGAIQAGFLVACAGLQSDRLAASDDPRPGRSRIVPFRGDFFGVEGASADLIHGLVYPVPNPSFPFLGVHFTRGIDDRVLVGPNAVLALAREAYKRTGVNLRDAQDALLYPGVWRLAGRHAGTGAMELLRDFSKRALLRQIRRYVPDLDGADLRYSSGGIRAQLMDRDGTLVDDFRFIDGDHSLHVLNAPSPAATAALAIGEIISDRALARLG